MAINALYVKYFQKSKIFIYPLLDIKRGSPVLPIETYISWGNSYKPEDMKLICVYPTRLDNVYIQFEKNVLLTHNRICDYIKVDNENTVVTFDFSDLSDDWNYFLQGRYSKLKDKTKRMILNYFDKSGSSYTYVNSYLFPEKFFHRYAELLDVNISLLESVGELCNKPDLEKENLTIQVTNLENINILD